MAMVNFTTKDSGKREKHITGAVRDVRTGKGRYDLLPAFALKRDAELLERGAEKYDARNWEKGFMYSRCMDSAIRHLFQHMMGDRSEDHLAAARFNVAAVMTFEETHPELDDLPDYSFKYDKNRGVTSATTCGDCLRRTDCPVRGMPQDANTLVGTCPDFFLKGVFTTREALSQREEVTQKMVVVDGLDISDTLRLMGWYPLGNGKTLYMTEEDEKEEEEAQDRESYTDTQDRKSYHTGACGEPCDGRACRDCSTTQEVMDKPYADGPVIAKMSADESDEERERITVDDYGTSCVKDHDIEGTAHEIVGALLGSEHIYDMSIEERVGIVVEILKEDGYV